MAIEMVRRELRAARRDEYVVLMDDYGAELHLAIPVSWTAAQRQAKLDAATAQHAAGEAALEAWAGRGDATAKADLERLKAAGLKRKALARKAAAQTGG